MLAHLPSLVVALTVFLLFGTVFMVGRARVRHGIKAPATSGHPDFDRVFRVQMNTLENAVAFLPSLWLATTYGSHAIAGIAGLVWVLARVWYAVTYAQDAAKRGPAFLVSMVALAVVLGTGVFGLLRAMIG
ncbi:MAPEG family protein [Tahibacter amnicola]|uniref:MAPEG family protein n=1 Tax=Tahibacter amnicola TaxID=2976241 RepID=A0ABY6BI60_9GAMM|nr:MAPEG family protein [Tahibacter amnicola]UXI68050.1 MAPEG family protein [Tahibacter amnicola]